VSILQIGDAIVGTRRELVGEPIAPTRHRRNLGCRHLEEYFETSVSCEGFRKTKSHEPPGHTCRIGFEQGRSKRCAGCTSHRLRLRVAEGRATVRCQLDHNTQPHGYAPRGILCDIADAAMEWRSWAPRAKGILYNRGTEDHFLPSVWEAHLKAGEKLCAAGQSLGYVEARSRTNAAGSLPRQRRLASC